MYGYVEGKIRLADPTYVEKKNENKEEEEFDFVTKIKYIYLSILYINIVF